MSEGAEDMAEDHMNPDQNEGSSNENEESMHEASEIHETEATNDNNEPSNDPPFNQSEKVVFSDENLTITCQKVRFRKIKKFNLRGNCNLDFMTP